MSLLEVSNAMDEGFFFWYSNDRNKEQVKEKKLCHYWK